MKENGELKQILNHNLHGQLAPSVRVVPFPFPQHMKWDMYRWWPSAVFEVPHHVVGTFMENGIWRVAVQSHHVFPHLTTDVRESLATVTYTDTPRYDPAEKAWVSNRGEWEPVHPSGLDPATFVAHGLCSQRPDAYSVQVAFGLVGPALLDVPIQHQGFDIPAQDQGFNLQGDLGPFPQEPIQKPSGDNGEELSIPAPITAPEAMDDFFATPSFDFGEMPTVGMDKPGLVRSDLC